jgi:hypothetical protein
MSQHVYRAVLCSRPQLLPNGSYTASIKIGEHFVSLISADANLMTLLPGALIRVYGYLQDVLLSEGRIGWHINAIHATAIKSLTHETTNASTCAEAQYDC